MAILKLENINFRYDREWILNDISCEVNAGDFVGVIGPNGSGKTTLLRIIDGLLVPQNGGVWIKGAPISTMKRRDVARIIAVVPQDSEMTFPFTAEEVVLMGRSPHLGLMSFEGETDFRIAQHAMEMTDIIDLAPRRMNELSGGERQRVLIARALAQEPEVMLLDEPTAFLDIRHQMEILDLAKKLNKTKGVTVVAVTHDINLASMYCDRIIFLQDGSIRCMGSPDAVISETHIRDVYGIQVLVDTNPVAGCPRVTMIGASPSEQGSRCEAGAAPQL
jgi:iron complex transport system ATP-binding protein